MTSDSGATTTTQADGVSTPLPAGGEAGRGAGHAPNANGNVHRSASRSSSARGKDEAPVSKWLHSPEVTQMRTNLEHQIRAKPGRALLLALGVGYVIGRVLRGKRGT